MSAHHVVPTVQAETPDHWREAIRERWRMTLLSAWTRDGGTKEGVVPACAKKVIFVRQKPRMLRSNAGHD